MPFKELYGSRKVTIASNGLSGERRFLSPWGSAQANAPAIGTPFPGILGLYADSIDIQPYGKAVPGDDAAEHALIVVRYSSLDRTQQQQTGRKLDESLEFGGEMLTKAGGKWKDCEVQVKKEDIGGTWYPRLEYTLDATVDSLPGKEINKILTR